MIDRPSVDINLFVYNGVDTIGPVVESILAQTWSDFTLTIADDASMDGTPDVIATFARCDGRIRMRRHRHNGGAVAAFQRAFWHGDADFVMPKSGDDLLAPDFIEKTLAVLLANPDCTMCHAQGLVFTGEADIRALYPSGHALHAVGPDPVARARQVMARYTSSPSFWGIYRRAAVDRLARIRHRAGWDHALLAELALYGEIRYVAEPLYWRRDGGKPVLQLARASTERGARGLDVDDPITEPHWRTPMIATVIAHLEAFAVARVDAAERDLLFAAAIDIFRARWLGRMRQEARMVLDSIPDFLSAGAAAAGADRNWIARQLSDLLYFICRILPEVDVTSGLNALHGGRETHDATTRAA